MESPDLSDNEAQMLEDIETWFLLNRRDYILEFAGLFDLKQFPFTLEVYSANTFLMKAIKAVNIQYLELFNPVRVLIEWDDRRNKNSYNVVVYEPKDGCYGRFDTLDQYNKEEAYDILNAIHPNKIWIVSLKYDRNTNE